MQRLLKEAKEMNVFYYSTLQKFLKEEGMPWFSTVRIGKNSLDRYVKDMCLVTGIKGKTKQSLRASGTTRMYRQGILKRLSNLGAGIDIEAFHVLISVFHHIRRGVCVMFSLVLLISCCLLDKLSVSLVPRPFPPPVFDRLQYANTEGEGLGDLIMCGYVR